MISVSINFEKGDFVKNLFVCLFFFVVLLYSENEVTRVRYIELKELKPETTIHFILSKLSAQQQEDFFSKLMLNENGLAMQIYAEPLLGLEKYEMTAIFKYFGMSDDHDFGMKDKQQLFGELHSANLNEKGQQCGEHANAECRYHYHGTYICKGTTSTTWCNTCSCK